MSRFCFLLTVGLLFCGRSSESAASITWEWRSESLDVVGTIIIDDTNPQFLTDGWIGDFGGGILSFDFYDRTGARIRFGPKAIILGPDRFSPVGARVGAIGGENSWREVGISDTSDIWFFLTPRLFYEDPAAVDAFLNAYPEAGESDSGMVFATDGVLRAIAPVPEPATLAVWSLLGIVGGGVYWKRRTH